ncbi:hypothetical protein ACXM2N_08795 [Corynebacterium sp. ZY180755]
MNKRTTTAILLTLLLLAAGSIFLWKHFPSTPKTTGAGTENSDFIGISTETSGSLTSSDRNNLFWTSKSGSGGVAFSVAPTYFPSLLRIGGGFATPDENSILLVDQDLQKKKLLPVPDLKVGTQSASTNSLDQSQGAFLFNIGDSNNSDAGKVVAVSSNSVRSIDREKHVSALTACNDGTIKWIEFSPQDSEKVGSNGTAKIVTWSNSGEIKTSDIIWNFPYELGHENHLSCNSPSSAIVSEDKIGNPLSLILEDRGEKTFVKKTIALPTTSPPAMARFSTVFRDTLYSLDKERRLTAVNIKTGTLEYSEQLNVDGPSPISITFENDKAFLVIRPDKFKNKQAVLPVNLKNPRCIGEAVRLYGYDETSQKSKIERLGDSFMATTTVLPKSPDYRFTCR